MTSNDFNAANLNPGWKFGRDKYVGEMADADGKRIGYLYKQDGGYVVIKRADFSGKIIGALPGLYQGKELLKIRTENLGYARVNVYSFK